MPLNFVDAPAELRHLNIRKEGPEDGKVLAVDLKLQVILDAMYLHDFDEQLEDTLFTFRNGDYAVRFPQMGPIDWKGEMAHMQLELAKIEIRDAKVHRFSIEPDVKKAGKFITLSCSVSFKPNSGRQLALLAELVGETALLGMQPAADLLTEAKAEDDPRAAMKALDAMVRADGATAELRGPDGTTLLRFGENTDAPKPGPRKRGRPRKNAGEART